MLKEEFPGTKFLLGPGLHRVAPGVEEVRGGVPPAVRMALDSYEHRASITPYHNSSTSVHLNALWGIRTRFRGFLHSWVWEYHLGNVCCNRRQHDSHDTGATRWSRLFESYLCLCLGL